MDAMAALVLTLAQKLAPPGASPYSVLVMPECGSERAQSACAGQPLCSEPALHCHPPKWSPQRAAWIRVESPELGRARYQGIAARLSQTAHRLHACSPDTATCDPIGWTGSELELVLSTLTVALHESGLRRDIQFGEGPLGRGPDGEACLLQLDPEQAPRFASWLPPGEGERIARSAEDREAFARSLLGDEPEALTRCFEIGMRMLARARQSCSRAASPEHGMFSMFGSGTTCDAPILRNRTRTLARLRAAASAEAAAKQ